jgi:hypothetical protein
MPVLSKVDFGGAGALSATWLAPEFWTFQVASDKKTAVAETMIGQKLVAQALIFILAPVGGKPEPGLKDAAARAVLRLPDGSALTSIRMPSMIEKEFAGDPKKPGSPVLVAFPSQRPDGSPILAPGSEKLRLEVAGAVGEPPRAFEWSLPIPYPAPALQALQRLAAQHEARVQAFAPSAADLPEAAISWLAEFAAPRSGWLAMVWCPAEWWELNWKNEKKGDEGTRAGFRLLFNDLTTFMLMSFERKEAPSLAQRAERCVLIDGEGTRHTPVKLPDDFQKGFAQGVGRALKNKDMAIFMVAFKVKLDAATQQPFRIVLEEEPEQPAATFHWRPPLALPQRLSDAFAAAHRP